jgi:hypothetical protein
VSLRAALLILVAAAEACGGSRTTAVTGSAGSGGAGLGTSGSGGSAGGAVAATGPRVSEFLGVNGFIDDPVEKLAAIGNVR